MEADDSKEVPTPSESEGKSKDEIPINKESEGDKKEEDPKEGANETGKNLKAEVISPAPGITVSLLLFWALPVLFLALASHYVIDTKTPPKPI